MLGPLFGFESLIHMEKKGEILNTLKVTSDRERERERGRVEDLNE